MTRRPYQPLWRGGRQVTPGERPSSDRYEAIRSVLDSLTFGHERRFSVLDVGAYSGYFTQRLVEDYACTATAIDDNHTLLQIASDDVTVIPRRVQPRELWALPRHDVTLALSVLHHFADWAGALEAIRACRSYALIEVAHPDERWMTTSASRHDVGDIHDAVAAAATDKLGAFEFDRRGFQRSMFLVPGTVRRMTGTVFAGSGHCSRRLPLFSQGLDRALGYQPFMGSLNLCLADDADLGVPHINWVARHGNQVRDYQFWRAWIDELACHVMVPGKRNHGPDVIEMVAPFRLRDHMGLVDGSKVAVDVELGS